MDAAGESLRSPGADEPMVISTLHFDRSLNPLSPGNASGILPASFTCPDTEVINVAFLEPPGP